MLYYKELQELRNRKYGKQRAMQGKQKDNSKEKGQ